MKAALLGSSQHYFPIGASQFLNLKNDTFVFFFIPFFKSNAILMLLGTIHLRRRQIFHDF